MYGSVDPGRSRSWYQLVCDVVSDVDGAGRSLAVQESETDVKIHLRTPRPSGAIFTKGNGIRLYAEHMGFNLAEGSPSSPSFPLPCPTQPLVPVSQGASSSAGTRTRTCPCSRSASPSTPAAPTPSGSPRASPAPPPSRPVTQRRLCRSEELKERVGNLCEAMGNRNYAFASCPSVLLGAMAQVSSQTSPDMGFPQSESPVAGDNTRDFRAPYHTLPGGVKPFVHFKLSFHVHSSL